MSNKKGRGYNFGVAGFWRTLYGIDFQDLEGGVGIYRCVEVTFRLIVHSFFGYKHTNTKTLVSPITEDHQCCRCFYYCLMCLLDLLQVSGEILHKGGDIRGYLIKGITKRIPIWKLDAIVTYSIDGVFPRGC